VTETLEGRLGELGRVLGRRVTFMEVCGTHTVELFRTGVRSMLPREIRLVSGPGCPVCVTDQTDIDATLFLARLPGVIMATYGDMLRVPGSRGSLGDARGEGADVRVITSAAQALEEARRAPFREVVFCAVGFETTAPATAAVLQEARRQGIKNFSVLSLHKRVPPALELLASAPDLAVDGFLLPGHVGVILGEEPFRFLPEKFGRACALTGFEAEEMAAGIAELGRQVILRAPAVRSVYPRAVRPGGNPRARSLMEEVFSPARVPWRGLGEMDSSGLALREDFFPFDARRRFALPHLTPTPTPCACGAVLSGRIDPPECPLFGAPCTPASPVGPCMVSSEGSCAAHHRFGRGWTE